MDAPETPAAPADDGKPKTIRLRSPLKIGSMVHEEITLKFSSKALRGFKVELTASGGLIMDQHALLLLAMRLADLPSIGADQFDNKSDVNEVTAAAMGFIS